jgi:hypothetical protein
VSRRPLALVSGLTLGDYLLWSWSLNHNRDVLALISGLTLPPLAVACLWLLALSIARTIASARRSRARPGVRSVLYRHRGQAPREVAAAAESLDQAPAQAASSGPASGKLAA